MAGHSRPKAGVASARLCRPSTSLLSRGSKTWMPGTSPGMTVERMARAALLPTLDLPAHQRNRLLVDARGIPGLDGRKIRFARLIAGAGLPAMRAQEVRGRVQRVRRVLEIAGAVRQNRLGHELRLADLAMHGAALARREHA